MPATAGSACQDILEGLHGDADEQHPSLAILVALVGDSKLLQEIEVLG
jgi:hypothetical protein